ncbi:unnamed protein product [Musa acuminata subsp. burmannicoides]
MASGDAGGGGVDVLLMDEAYEFSAPRFFDFINGETEEYIKTAELWFETSLSYAPSPFVPRIKEGRSIQIDSLCDFGNVEKEQKVEVSSKDSHQTDPAPEVDNTARNYQHKLATDMEVKAKKDTEIEVSEVECCQTNIVPQQETSLPCNSSTSVAITGTLSHKEVPLELPIALSGGALAAASAAFTYIAQASSTKAMPPSIVNNNEIVEGCTPRTQRSPVKGVTPSSAKTLAAKRIANLIRQTLTLKQKSKSPTQSLKSTKRKNVIKCPSNIAAKNSMGNDIAQENQAVKRQKLHDGRFRQIHNVKNGVLHHKSRLGLTGGTDMLTNVDRKEVSPYVSAAEMVNKFQSRTRDLDIFQNRSLSHSDTASAVHRRSKLTLTRPKDPELGTAHRARAVRIKSSAELEEEMLSKIPKFKARPLNKKILEAPTFPALPRSIPQPPVFQEFRLKTMERANQHAETSSAVSSLDGVVQNQVKPIRLTEPRPPHLETSFRARPPKNKSSQESKLEELEKIPKFKARPLNKKILESKREIGMFCNPKPQKTIPQEFHFATEDRLGPPATVVEIFDKLSLHSESSNHEKKEVPRITIPNPFHLHTEKRGLEKESQLAEQLLQKELEEEWARIPKATPYPYAIDYPVIPPKPEPKQCTKPEAFQLESLVRHEEEMLRKLEEKERTEREEAQQRIFRAQAIKNFDHLQLPERERKPLTEVQKFVLHVDHRSVQRMEFDRKIKEKELRFKRLREEQESAKMIEEEKAVKQMRRTMVPHARPLPKFNNPFISQKSMKQGTKPKSPDLRVNHRVERRHSQWTAVISVTTTAHLGKARNAEAMSGCSRAQYTLASGLGALAHAGDHCGLLSLFFHSSRAQPVRPDRPIYLALLKAAAAVSSRSTALSLHAHIAKSGYQRDVVVATALVHAFSRCSDSATARRLFDEIPERDAAAWNAMLSGCARNGDSQKALSMAYEMASCSVRPNTVTLSVLLQVCGGVEDKRLGQSVHAYAVRHLQLVDTFLGNSLVVYYNRAGDSHISERIFERMLRRDIVSWNAMITGRAQCGFGWRALELFNLMREEHHPDLFSLVKLQVEVYEQNSLLLFYCKCGMMESAQSIFDKMEARNIVSWNILINEALEHLRSMHVNACSLDAVTIVNMLSLCTGTLNLRSGKVIHGFMLRNKHDHNVFAITALLEHYAKCGAVTEACYLFLEIPVRNRVTWNTMVHCCVHNGFPRTSVKLFYLMQEQDGFMPDATSVVGVIKAIAQRGYEEEKNYIHKYVTERGFTDDEFVANSLISMHARFHDFDKAISVFERTSKLSTVTWNTMISGYSNYGLANKAMPVYHLMKLQNVAPDLIHTVICKAGYESDMFVGTSLVYGYAKCGDLSMARLIFDGLESKSTVSWNSMIQGYGVHGNAEAVHELFSEMQQSGKVPTVVTFLNIISACSHVGDVEKGKHYYDVMTRVHSVIPNRELLSSLADLLGRSGRLKEAHEVLEKGPLDPGLDAWGALLGACRIQGNLEIGMIAANNVLELDPIHHGYNLLLSNMHAEAGRWIVASKIRKRVDKTGLNKASGWSMVEVMINVDQECKKYRMSPKPLDYESLNENVKKVAYAVRGELYLRASELQKEGKKIIFTNVGNPHALGQKPLTFPRQVVALCQAPFLLDDPHVGILFPADAIARAKHYLSLTSGGLGAYSDSRGLPGIRKEVAEFIERRDGYPSDPELIYLTDGASKGVMQILNTVIRNEKDGILVPVPQYPLYSAAISLFGGSLVPYYLEEEANWGLDINHLRQSVATARMKGITVRAMVIINPGNPTGQCLSEANLNGLLKFCFQENLVLLADEVYQQNIYQDERPFISARKILLDMGPPMSKEVQLVSFHTVSKGYWGECGQRGGYFEMTNIPAKTVDEIYKVASVSLSPNVPGQIFMGLMVNPLKPGDISYLRFVAESKAILESLKRRAHIMTDGFNSCRNVVCNFTEGAMYSFPQIRLPPRAIEAAKSAGKAPDVFYCLKLLEATGISTVPGSGFGQKEGVFHLRTTILPAEEDMPAIMTSFKKFNDEFMEQYEDYRGYSRM